MPTTINDGLRTRITVDPDICNGRPTIRATRLTAVTIIDLLAAGDTQEDILATYPFLEPDDIRACLYLARDAVDNRSTTLAAE